MAKLTLLLARGPDKPDGDLDDRLVMRLSLTPTGQIDTLSYEQTPEPWLAMRALAGHGSHALEVVRIDEGWALQSINSLDDPIWAFEGHVFRPGELVRLQRPDGQEMLYRIVSSESE